MKALTRWPLGQAIKDCFEELSCLRGMLEENRTGQEHLLLRMREQAVVEETLR